ncbi:ASCH domain-containing protein [Dickeya fangzhongdai]|uniref:ASCH domain-containing protein n=1 Tax=Dickeya fangzhongdai TaxID=1778540 RepID=UPI0026DF1A9E|nr:ASCH domain-containing protein [Dickeya fangzhongdai]WKV51076.1 ASCH domain-containing protein [Dickeya fangzhongdai]
MNKKLVKALSVVSPAGQLIASGRKTIEVRKWLPDITPDEDIFIVENTHYLMNEGEEEPGIVVAVVNVASVRSFTPDDIPAAGASSFEDGWYAWELCNVRQLRADQYVRAARKIYYIEYDYQPGTPESA